jgi:GR25 family glycosyltransferase involved in LPS biosynthesis
MIIELLQHYNVTKIVFQNDEQQSLFINQHVQHIYVINLESNLVRRNYIQVIMKKMQINYELIIVQPPTQQQIQYFATTPLTKGEIGCYLSHMYCYHNAMQNNYSNIIVFEDDIIFHQHFHHLYETIQQQKKYDILMLGASDYHFNKTNCRRVHPTLSTYCPEINHTGILGCHAIYFSQEAYSHIFSERLKHPTFMDDRIVQFLNYFSNSFSICYPNLLLPEMSTTNLSHHIWITNHKKEKYYFKKCLHPSFSFQNYHYLYLDIFHCCQTNNHFIKINQSFEQNIKNILALYFKNNLYYLEIIQQRLRYDFFSVDDLLCFLSFKKEE